MMTLRSATISFVFGAMLLATACSGPANRSYAGPVVLVSSTSRAACESIEMACDPYEQSSGLARECHDLGRSPSTDEATCVARKSQCLAACPMR